MKTSITKKLAHMALQVAISGGMSNYTRTLEIDDDFETLTLLDQYREHVRQISTNLEYYIVKGIEAVFAAKAAQRQEIIDAVCDRVAIAVNSTALNNLVADWVLSLQDEIFESTPEELAAWFLDVSNRNNAEGL